MLRRFDLFFCMAMTAGPALAGPPYVTDDPQPTDDGHYEIYLFENGTAARDGAGGEAGIDFNYGAAPDLQLTAVLPLGYSAPAAGPGAVNLGTIELAAKYKFLHQDDFGLDASFFPRVFLPAGSPLVGERHAALLLPLWLEKDWEPWSLFGGGGCQIDRGGASQDFCLFGAALTRQVLPDLQIGGELYHQTANTRGGRNATGMGAGVVYDLDEHYHLIASFGPGLQNASETGSTSWYTAIQFTF